MIIPCLVQTVGCGSAEIALRMAGDLTGRWSELETFYRPEEYGIRNILIYAGKSHPELVGSDLFLTYVANHLDFSHVVNHISLYFPRFLRGGLISVND